MVARRTEWLARQICSLTSCCPQSGLFQTASMLFPLFIILGLPTTPHPTPQQGKVLLSHKIQPTLFLLCHLPQHPGDDIQSTGQPVRQIIMDTNSQPPVSQSSKLYFYPAIALVGGHHPARGTTQILKCLKSVLHVFLPYPPPTLPTALTPTNTCKCACELPKGKNLFYLGQ